MPSTFYRITGLLLVLAVSLVHSRHALGQSGLRESLERLDRNGNGKIDPHEITSLARPYLERITRERRIDLDDPVPIERLQEAARSYYAIRNGAVRQSVRPEIDRTVKTFRPDDDQILIPEFGLAEVKYPYVDDDVDEADGMLRRYDRNGDGFIDRREAYRIRWTHRNPFDDDLNRDERLSRLELVQRYARRRMLSDDSRELIQKARRTGGEIRPASRASQSSRYSRGRSQRDYYLTASVMGRFDTNQNGRLEANEATQLGISVGKIDADRDGEISRDELHAYMTDLQEEAGIASDGLPAWFFERDLDRDGQVAMHEFADEWTIELRQEFQAIDANGDGLLTPREATNSTALVGGQYRSEEALVLPPGRTVISEIDVQDDFLIRDLNVHLSITHTYTGQLDAYLTGPDGQRVELFTEIGGSGDHFEDTVFDDDASYPITRAKAPYTGSFLPEGRLKKQPSLNSFTGSSVNGVWQLVIRGTRSERFGMLHSWGLSIKPQDADPGRLGIATPATTDESVTSEASEASPQADAPAPTEALTPNTKG
ncbi:MAG: proprotein convertase P-domain-containing protein [Planctomycetota bacterium]|jgi:subtilisin-like proprotein convertase family protein